MVGELTVLDRSGDTKIVWDSDNPPEVEAARASFAALRGKGYLAYKVKKGDGSKGEVISSFDPDAEAIILAPPMRGG